MEDKDLCRQDFKNAFLLASEIKEIPGARLVNQVRWKEFEKRTGSPRTDSGLPLHPFLWLGYGMAHPDDPAWLTDLRKDAAVLIGKLQTASERESLPSSEVYDLAEKTIASIAKEMIDQAFERYESCACQPLLAKPGRK